MPIPQALQPQAAVRGLPKSTFSKAKDTMHELGLRQLVHSL